MRPNKKEQKSLALWAADCAEHVLPSFDKNRPDDDRPRKAIESARAWARGEIPVSQARKAAFAAHAAARNAAGDNAACAAARAAGHAAATAHVATHAPHAAAYALKAATDLATERKWQRQRFSKHLLKQTARKDDKHWENLLSYPNRRPKLDAFLHESAAENETPLDASRL